MEGSYLKCANTKPSLEMKQYLLPICLTLSLLTFSLNINKPFIWKSSIVQNSAWPKSVFKVLILFSLKLILCNTSN